MNAAKTVWAACLCVVAGSGWCAATERSVETSGELMEALRGAESGDRILLAAGRYVISAEVTVGPLTIESAEAKDKPVLSPVEGGAFVIDAGNVEGTITIRGLVFDGGGEAGALQTLGSRLEVEDCLFHDFSGKAVIRSGVLAAGGKDNRSALRGIRLTRCVFRSNPTGCAVSSIGPAVVEDCALENIRGGLSFEDWSKDPRRDYKVIVRRNHIYRTEGTDWKCHGITTRTTAPEVCENLIHDLSKGDCSAMTIASNGRDRDGTPTAATVCRNVIIDKWKAADSGMIHEGIEYGEYRPTKGRIFENVLVGYISPALYNKGDENAWFNNTLVLTKGDPFFFHCYGLKCRYYNNVQVGGRAIMLNQERVNEWIAKKNLGPTCTSEDHTMEHSCFWHVGQDTFVRGEGFFEADPKFVDPENLDFHLRFDSPCINKGEGSRDGLTPTDLGAFEYPIQVCDFKVDAKGVATWTWSNDFRKVSKRVHIRWNAKKFPESADAEGDETVAEVDASKTSAPTGKTSGYFAAFVLDAKDRWSGPAPDGVHRFAVEVK